MVGFLVETYAGHATSEQLDDIVGRLRSAADALRRRGTPVRHVRAFHVPEDEITYHVYEAEKPDDVRRAIDAVGVEAERVVVLLDSGAVPDQ